MSIYRLLLDFLGLFWLKTVKQTKIEEKYQLFVDIFDTFRRFLLVPILLGQYFYVFNNTVKRSIRLSFLYKGYPNSGFEGFSVSVVSRVFQGAFLRVFRGLF